MHHHLQTSGGVSSVDLLAACLEQCVEIEYLGMLLMFKWFREQAGMVKSSLCSESPKDNSIATMRIIRNR